MVHIYILIHTYTYGTNQMIFKKWQQKIVEQRESKSAQNGQTMCCLLMFAVFTENNHLKWYIAFQFFGQKKKTEHRKKRLSKVL